MIHDRFKALPQVPVCDGGCFIGTPLNPATVKMSSPAVDVMTDLTRIPPATIEPSATLQQANHAMILRGVRLLFVTEPDGRVGGVVTVRDLVGDKPVRMAQARNAKRDELEVRDVMTPLEDMEAIEMTAVLRSQVGHVVATLEKCGRQHTLVVERPAGSKQQVLRGLFSVSQIARQLGVELTTHEVARTFAEINAAFVEA